jgi:hypothetical protein
MFVGVIGQVARLPRLEYREELPMDLLKMLTELRAELSQIEAAIIAFERIARGQRKRRGRPPKWMSQSKEQPRTRTDAPKKRTLQPDKGEANVTKRKRSPSKTKPEVQS